MSDLLKVRVGGSDYLVKGPVANYAMVDSDGYIIVDEDEAAVVGIDYLTSQESVERVNRSNQNVNDKWNNEIIQGH